MLTVKIPAAAIRAASFCMAEKDIRCYLNGILLDVTGPGEAFIVGTDGSVLFAGRAVIEHGEEKPTAPYKIIIPAETIKALDKKAPFFTLEEIGGGRYLLGGKTFTPVDGVYPDYRRVIPHKCSGESAQFNPDLLNKGVNAIKTFYGVKKSSDEWGVSYDGANGPAVIYGRDNSAVAVVSPLRRNHKEVNEIYTGFLSPCESFEPEMVSA